MSANKLHWIGGHTSPRKAFGGLVDGAMVHAISDGTWGLSDGICEILRIVGKCDLVVSTRTAGHADLKRAEKMLRAKEVRSFRLGVVARIGCQVLTQAFATTTDMLNAA